MSKDANKSIRWEVKGNGPRHHCSTPYSAPVQKQLEKRPADTAVPSSRSAKEPVQNSPIGENHISAIGYMNRAHICKEQGQFEQAIANYTKAIELDTQNVEAYIGRGTAYHADDQHDMAISDYTKAIEIEPMNAKAYCWRAGAYRIKNQCQLAISDYTEALEIDPMLAEAYRQRGTLYLVMNQNYLAISDYTKVIEISPLYRMVYVERGNAYRANGEYDLAISDYNKDIEIEPRHGLAYYCRGLCHHERGQYDLAIIDYTRTIEISHFTPAYEKRALAYCANGDYHEAWCDVHEIQASGEQIDPALLRQLNSKEAHISIKDKGKRKNCMLAVVLGLFFGPFGTLYFGWAVFLTTLITYFLVSFLVVLFSPFRMPPEWYGFILNLFYGFWGFMLALLHNELLEKGETANFARYNLIGMNGWLVRFISLTIGLYSMVMFFSEGRWIVAILTPILFIPLVIWCVEGMINFLIVLIATTMGFFNR